MGAGTSAGRQGGRRRTRAAGLRAQGQRLIDRADSLDRDAERWEKGEEGERVVGAALDALQAQGWIVMHDVRWPGRRRANIDHVAIGPPGILVVDAKNWSGTVAIRHGRLKQNGYGRDKEVDGVSRAAGAVGELLDLPWALHVIPVLCLAQPIAVQPTNLGQVTVVQLTDLTRWATSLTPRLEPGDVLGIAEHLRGALASASLPAPRQPSTRSYGAPVMRRDRAVPSVKRRRPRSTLRGRRRPRSTVRPVLLKLALLAAVLLAGPPCCRSGSTGETTWCARSFRPSRPSRRPRCRRCSRPARRYEPSTRVGSRPQERGTRDDGCERSRPSTARGQPPTIAWTGTATA
jgi:hypothetical protein